MNELQVFQNTAWGAIRTVKENGKVLFCAVDVARSLQYKDTTNAIKAHCRGVVKRHLTDSLGREQLTNFIPIGDLCRLAAKSQVEGADRFESWIFDDVIPKILETGSYDARPLSPAEQLLAQAQLLIDIERRQNAQQEQIEDLRSRTESASKKISDAVQVFRAPSFSPDTWQDEANARINELVEQNGLNHQRYRQYLYERLEQIAHVDLDSRQTRRRNRMKAEGKTATQQKAVSKLQLIAEDPKLRPIPDGILREEQAKYLCT